MTTQPKEPLLRMAKRDSIPPRAAWGIRAAAFLLALITGGLLLLLLGHNPITVYSAMISGAWGSPTVARETVKIAVPLLITSIGISLAFRMKFWNIGAEGQILVGAIAAGWFGLFTATIFPKIPLVLLMMASSMILGGLYGLLPAICKAKWGTNETLFTLMLNYIALAFVKYLMNGPWKAPGSSYPKIAMLAPGARLTKVLGVHWGWILALVLVVVSYVYITRTKQGYEIAVVGESRRTASYAGIKVDRVIIRTMALSGALCGLIGLLLTSSTDHTMTTTIVDGRGFTAVMVSWMANFNPIIMIFVSLLLVVLNRGAGEISTAFGLNRSFADILTGIILFFIIGCEFFINYKVQFRTSGKKEA